MPRSGLRNTGNQSPAIQQQSEAKLSQGVTPSSGNQRAKRKAADSTALGSAKKAKETSSAANATPPSSQLRRGSRSRTARQFQEVSPGPALTRAARAGSTAKQAAHSKQQQQQPTPASAAKSTTRSNRRHVESSPHAEPTEAALPAGAAAEESAQPRGTEDHVNSCSSLLDAEQRSPLPAQPEACPTADQASPQAQVGTADVAMQDAVTPCRPAELKSPCTVPQQHGLPPIPHNLPSSPIKLTTDLADNPAPILLATASIIPEHPAAVPAKQAAETVLDVLAARPSVSACENSSQEGSRHSSGHSNDHQGAVHARKHLDWGAAEGSDSKPAIAQQSSMLDSHPAVAPASHSTGDAAEATAADETWWDPSDIHKVGCPSDKPQDNQIFLVLIT